MGDVDRSRTDTTLQELELDAGDGHAELLRTRDVAKAFQVSERTVAEWARRGRIPSGAFL